MVPPECMVRSSSGTSQVAFKVPQATIVNSQGKTSGCLYTLIHIYAHAQVCGRSRAGGGGVCGCSGSRPGPDLLLMGSPREVSETV